MKFCHSQVNGWNWRTSSYVKLPRLRKRKVTCPPSYVDYRPKTNAAILLDMGHSKGKLHTGRIPAGEGNQKLDCG
jgi:hypothetical protein